MCNKRLLINYVDSKMVHVNNICLETTDLKLYKGTILLKYVPKRSIYIINIIANNSLKLC